MASEFLWTVRFFVRVCGSKCFLRQEGDSSCNSVAKESEAGG